MPFDWSKPLDAAPQRGLTGSQFSGAIDNYQANLYGLGEAVAPKGAIKDWMRSGRESNEFLAEEAAQRARSLGAVDKFDDVNNIGDFGSYAKSLAIGSLPYMGEMLVGGVAARGLSGGLRAAAGAGRTAGATEAATTAGRAAEKALATRSQAGALAAAYPSAVGDVLSAQRDAAPDGDTNLGSALAGGAVYDALNLLGVGGTLAKGGLARNTIRAFDAGDGFRAGAKRMGLTALRTGAEESLGETGQEMVNQSFGRMAVNPDETLFSDEALKRYKESAIGGFVLGGAFGSVGGYRRSQGYQSPSVAPTIEAGQQGNLLQLGLDPNVKTTRTGQFNNDPYYAFPDGSTMTRAEYQATFGDNPNPGGPGPSSPVNMQRQEMLKAAVESGEITPAQAKQMGYVEAVNQPFQNAARAGEGLNTQSMVDRTTGVARTPYAGKGYEQQFEAAASAPPDGSLTGEAQTRVPGEGQVEVPNTALDEVQRRAGLLNEQRLAEQQQAQEKAARAQRLTDLKLQPIHTGFLGQLDALVARNEITPEEVNFFAGKVSQNIKPNEALTMAKTLAETRRKVVEGNLAPSAAEEVAAEIKAGGNGNIALAVAKDRQKQLNGELKQQQREAAQAAEKQRKETEKAAKQAAIDADRQKRNAVAPKAAPPAPKPTKPANVINAEASKVDPSPAPVVSAPAVQPAAGPVVGETAAPQPAAQTESVDGGAGGSALEPAVEGRGNAAVPVVVRKTRRVTKDGTVVGAETPAPTASSNTLFTKAEVERRAEERRKRNAGKLNAGLDPRDLADLAYEVGYYIEQGVRSMAELMKKLVPQFGRGAIPHIRTAYARQLAKLGYEPTVVVGGVVDFSKLNDQLSDRPGYLRAARAVLGVDDEGYRINALSYAAAAQKYMGTKASGGTNLGAAMSKIGITAAVRAKTQLGRDVEVALPDIDLAMDPATLDEVVGKQEDTEAIDVQEQEKFDDRGVRLSDEEVAGDRGQEDALDANTDGLRQNSASSVGGSANGTDALKKGLITTKSWYTEPLAKAEGDLSKVPNEDLAGMALEATSYLDERNKPLVNSLIQEVRNRLASDPAGIAAALKKAEKEQYAKRTKAERPTERAAEEDVSEPVDGNEQVNGPAGQDEGPERKPKYDATTVIEEEKSDRLNAKEAREQAAAAEAVKARNKSVTITVNGMDREIGDAPSALAFANRKLADANLTSAKRAEYEAIKAALEAKLDIKLVKVANPDIGKETTIPSGITFKDGSEAANWLSKNADKPFVRLVAAKIAKALSGVNVVLVTDTSTLHPEIQEHFAKNARGLFVVDFNTVYVIDKYNTEEVWVHELLHAAITSKLADPATRAEVSVLAKRVSQSLDTTPSGSWPINDRDTLLLHKFFQSNAIFGDPDEFMAYALTSPSFQTLLSQLSADGSWIKPGAQGKLVAVPELSLMKKIVDFVRRLFGFEPKYTKEVTSALWKNKITQENNQRLLAEAQAKGKLEDTLHDLVSRLIVESADSTAQGRVSSGNTTGTNNTGKLDVKSNVGATKMAPAASSTTPASLDPIKVGDREKSIQKLPAALRPAARAINTVLSRVGGDALNLVNFTEDLLNRASAAGIKSAAIFKELHSKRANFVGAHERLVQNVSDMYATLPDRLKGKQDGTANAFLKESTMKRLWAYEPDHLPKGSVTIDPDMKVKFDALGTEGQEFVKAVFAHGAYTLQLKKDTLLANTSSSYDALIASAKKANETAKVAELEADKTKALSQFGSLMQQTNKTPYAPIKRFGKFVVIAKSDAYMAAEKEAEASGSTKDLRKMQGDENQYYVDFVDSDREADALRKQLADTGIYSNAEDGIIHRLKDDTRDQVFGGSGTLAAMEKLRSQIDAEYKSKDSKEMQDIAKRLNEMVTELYLSSLAESSARKSEARRKNVAGDIDMIRAFESQGKADANFLGAIKYNEPQMQAINDMRREMKTGASEDQRTKSAMFNEIMKRHLQSMDYNPAPLSSKLVNLTSKWFLATNPAYYLQNATQPWMMSLPVIAGRHEFKASGAALFQAYKDIAGSFTDAKLFDGVDFNKMLSAANTKLTDDEKAVLNDLLDRGRIDIGMATELGQFRIEGGSKAAEGWNKVEKGLAGLQTKLEALNRVATALAAYRLEKAKTNAAQAAEYADRIIQDTHGDYNAWNAPRAFNNDFGKIALQFKKYQLIQLSLMAKMVKQAFGNASDGEKASAKMALMFMFGQAAIVGGARALPIGVLGYALAAMFGDDDEPPEYIVRKFIGNKEVSDLLVGGVPALFGVDASKFGGMGQMLSILPFTDIDLTSRKGVAEAGYALLSGPLGGLTLKAADAMSYMGRGDFLRGTELLMPSGFANIMKAGREFTKGQVQKDGDVLTPAEEFTFLQTSLTAFGIQPAAKTERMYLQNAKYDITASLRQQSADLAAQYAMAKKEGESVSPIEAEWAKLQARRVEKQMPYQPVKYLKDAAADHAKTEKNTVSGMQFRKNEKRFVEDLVSR